MKIYSAGEAATELNIDPRALRRFLRNDASYKNAGMGGRYNFSEAELKSLRHAYAAHLKKHPAGKGRVVEDTDPRILDDDPGVPVEKLSARGLTASVRAQRAEARQLRQQRLVERMRAVGVTTAPAAERAELDA